MSTPASIRLYIPQPLGPGALLELSDGQCNYLKNVMRLFEGSRVSVFNGKDGEWEAAIQQLSKKHGTLVAEKKTREQAPSSDLWLVFAPIKHGRIDWLVEKAAELGVSRLLPVFTKHTIASRVNVERLSAHAREAAEQCERLDVPEVAEPQELDKMLRQWEGGRKIMLCDETGGGRPIHEALTAFKPGGPWSIWIGPEGGFSKSELEKLHASPHVVPVSLGPRVLRADTAALSAISSWQTLLGDWREGTPAFRSKE